jgi:hypothetical protein
MLNPIQTFNKLISEVFNPIRELFFNFKQNFSNVKFPVSNKSGINDIFFDKLAGIHFNILEVFHLFFKAFVNVNQVLLPN